MNNDIFPLSKAPLNKPLKLVEISGGRAIKQRLTEMGLIEGVRIEGVEIEKNGPCVILVGNARLMLGKGMADKIMVIKEDAKKITIALIGNPNSGKSTIFNNLTGERQHIGNYPGVTVEKKEGFLRYKDYELNITDLPGTYSLTTDSLDELVARNFILSEKPDVVIGIVDSSNLERSLYLSILLMEFEIPLVICLNMYDVATKQGFIIDKKRLSDLLGVPCVSTVATKKEGMDELIETAIRFKETGGKIAKISYGNEVDEEIEKIALSIKDENLLKNYPKRWLAIKLLENDPFLIDQINKSPDSSLIMNASYKSTRHLTSIFGEEAYIIIAEKRYGFISGVCSEAVKRSYETRHSISDKIDKVFLNKVLGIPIFLSLTFLIFKALFGISDPITGWIGKGLALLSGFIDTILPEGSIISSLIVNGIIGGVGNVLVFAPLIFLLYFVLAFLEDSGYIARVAFIMDSFMHKIGLHGRSFIPMLLGFGCNVPAILATRTIEDKRDRFATMLIIPFMSCGAKLPVYTLLIAAFFPPYQAYILFSIYLLGIIMAIIMAKIFKKYLFKGEALPFVMELPPYRIPTLKGLFVHMWERGSGYLKKAGGIILFASILIWFLSNFGLLEGIGRVISFIFKPLGFSNWMISISLVTGILAKETIISTLGIVGEIKEILNPLSAISFIVFILLYIPCLPTILAIKQEGGLKWAWFAILYTLIIAWLSSFLIFQIGSLFI